MQYAVMYVGGKLTGEQLLSYKDGRRGGLEAHADLYMDTGSLGQCLSASVGTALVRYPRLTRSRRRRAVILGDGEMQEGQVYEALMTIASRKLRELILFVDVNLYQSEHRTSEVKPIADLPTVLKGFGFTGTKPRSYRSP